MRRDRRFTIRRVSTDDLREVFSFGNQYCGETDIWPIRWDVDTVAAVLSRGMECSYLAEASGRVIGILLGEPVVPGKERRVIEIRWMAVDHAHENDGIPAALMEALTGGAYDQGIDTLRAALPGESPFLRLLVDYLGFSDSATLHVIEKKTAE
jgi:GNAT superfamily N-acetyltransferase